MPSQGPNFPGNITNTSAFTPEDAEPWTTPSNAGSDNGTPTTITAATFDSPDISWRLQALALGFDLPVGAMVDGIEVAVQKWAPAGSAVDYRAQLINTDNLVGENKANTTTPWASTEGAAAVYGSPTDDWNTAPLLTEHDSGSVILEVFGGPTGSIAQSFQFASEETVASVSLKLFKTGNPTDLLVVDLVDTLTGSPLASGTLDSTTVGATETFYRVKLDTPVVCSANTTYYIRLGRSGGADFDDYLACGASSSAGYANGSAWRNNTGSWLIFSNWDIKFRVYAINDGAWLEAVNSGVAFSAQATAANTDVSIDYISMTVYYSLETTEVTGNFTADAVLSEPPPPPPSFQADAFQNDAFQASIPPVTNNFTADAVLFKTTSATFTANSVLRVTAAATLTADANIRRIESGSFTADAVLLKITSGSFSADSVFRSTVAGSLTSDAITRRTESGTYTADAILFKVTAATLTSDSVLRTTVPQSFSADAVLALPVTVVGGTFASDAVLLRVESGSFTTNAVLKSTYEFTFSADVILRRTESLTFSADSVLNRVESGSFTANSILRTTVPSVFTGNSVIRRIEEVTFTADAVIKRTYSVTFTADAFLRQIVSGSFTGDSILRGTIAGSFTSDAITRRTEATTFTADAWVRRPNEEVGGFSADAVLRKLDIAGSFTADSFLSVRVEGSFTGAAVLRATASQTFTADSILRTSVPAQFAANSVLRITVEAQFTSDSILLRAESRSFTTDAAIRAVRDNSFTADAYFSKTFGGVFSVDAILSKESVSSFTADAVLFSPSFGIPLEAEFYVEQTMLAEISVEEDTDADLSTVEIVQIETIETTLMAEIDVLETLVLEASVYEEPD